MRMPPVVLGLQDWVLKENCFERISEVFLDANLQKFSEGNFRDRLDIESIMLANQHF